MFYPVVSTHSRLKAAGFRGVLRQQVVDSFNTQPPKGGWDGEGVMPDEVAGFNTQPPKGGWLKT